MGLRFLLASLTATFALLPFGAQADQPGPANCPVAVSVQLTGIRPAPLDNVIEATPHYQTKRSAISKITDLNLELALSDVRDESYQHDVWGKFYRFSCVYTDNRCWIRLPSGGCHSGVHKLTYAEAPLEYRKTMGQTVGSGDSPAGEFSLSSIFASDELWVPFGARLASFSQTEVTLSPNQLPIPLWESRPARVCDPFEACPTLDHQLGEIGGAVLIPHSTHQRAHNNRRK